MEKFEFQAILSSFFLVELLLLLLVSSSSSTKYFINCGSSSTITLPDGRKFDSDTHNSDSVSVLGRSETITNSSVLPANTSSLYQTARIFRRNSSYALNITDQGTYLVRLHFLAFRSEGNNLSDALFDVSTSKILLFSRRISTDEFPVVKELFLNGIGTGKLKIYFIPAKETSFAFINGIELIHLPKNFIPDKATTAPGNVWFNGLQFYSLLTLYRVNIGGPDVDEATDPIWRNWVKDDRFMLTNMASSKESTTTAKLNLGTESILDIAPDLVYKSCRHLRTNVSNISWSFHVRKRAMHFVRLHFCDFISPSVEILKIDLHISTNITTIIDPLPLSTPYFIDFVVNSDDSGFIYISIGPNKDSDRKDAYLNGLEIMEFATNTTLELNDVENSRNHNQNLIIGFSVGGVVLVLVFVVVMLLALLLMRRNKYRAGKSNVLKDEGADTHRKRKPCSWITATTETSSSPLPDLNLKLKMPLSEILAATRNFDTQLVIGEGGFGRVYKAILSTGTKVAVKRSHPSHGQGLAQFQNEVTVLSSIRHRHLVSLIGYCDEGTEMILVYEFMEKGTLRDHLYSFKNASTRPDSMTWKQRLEVCVGAAKGLHYLHTSSDWGIIHGDVKSTNILLDENYVAKVTDFGLSQSGPPDLDVHYAGLVGSFGYIDPEYIKTLQLTSKSDVYSFGVVLLEILCARPPIMNSTEEENTLAKWGSLWLNKGKVEKIIDPSLVGHINPSSLRKFAEIVEKCLKLEGTERPTMLDVCWDLEYALQLQKSAVQREPHEDTTTDVSSNCFFPASLTHFANEDDCVSIGDDDV